MRLQNSAIIVTVVISSFPSFTTCQKSFDFFIPCFDHFSKFSIGPPQLVHRGLLLTDYSSKTPTFFISFTNEISQIADVTIQFGMPAMAFLDSFGKLLDFFIFCDYEIGKVVDLRFLSSDPSELMGIGML